MEVPASLFFSFWAVIGITFLHLGFYALDKTELSDSVSPVIMSFIKNSFAIFTCHSSSYSLILRPRLKIFVDTRYYWVVFGLVHIMFTFNFNPEKFENYNKVMVEWSSVVFTLIQGISWVLSFFPRFQYLDRKIFLAYPVLFLTSEIFPWYIPISAMINLFVCTYPEYYITAQQKVGVGVHIAVETSLFIVGGKTQFYPILVFFVAYYTSVCWAEMSGLEPFAKFLADLTPGDEALNNLLIVAKRGKEILSTLKEKKRGKLIEFGVGLMGTVLFQYFFRLTTFNHVLAFLYLAVSWLANLALLGASVDFGVFNFLLNNVIVGCTVSQFGLRATTWLAYGSALVLYGLRLKLESLSFVDTEREEASQVILW